MLSSKTFQYLGKELEAMSFAKNYHKWILSKFLPYLGGSVAEVGAGIGNFSTLLLQQTNIDSLKAFEPSQNMYPSLQKALSQEKRSKAINDFFGRTHTPGECFDSVVYVNVLEHIKDDAFELTNAYKTLKPNGHLLIFAPALSWLYSDLDRKLGHFRRYTKEDLVKLVQQSGYSVVKAQYFDMVGIIFWYINFVLLKKQIDSGMVILYDRILVPVIHVLEELVPPPIGKNVLLVAKKD